MAVELLKPALECSLHLSAAISNNDQQATRPQVFHQFPNLPPELRNLIWDLAYSPQEIHIRQENFVSLVDGPISEHYLEYVNVPSALYTCKESRYLALKFYQLVEVESHVFQNQPGNRKIYVNFTHDDFRIQDENLCFSRMFAFIKSFNQQV